jgi:hypothetical protein
MTEMVETISNKTKEEEINKKRQKIEEINQKKLDCGTEVKKGPVTKVRATTPKKKVDQGTKAKKDGRGTSAIKEGRKNKEVSEKVAARSSGRNNNMVSEEVQEALTRGGGKAHKKKHGYGCRHYGVMDLNSMSELKDFNHYNKINFWLHGKICLGPGHDKKCSKKMTKEDMKPEKGSNIRLFYCDMGIRAEQYKEKSTDEEKIIYEDHECSMVLCTECKNIRQEEYMSVSAKKETRRRTTRSACIQEKKL